MMRNRAGLLALLVLIVASVLMVFFVLPRISGDKKPIGDAINQAGSAVKNIVAGDAAPSGDTTGKAAGAAQPSTSIATETTTKLAGMTGAATASLGELKALFSNGKGPTADVFSTAKTKALSTLQAIIDFAVPQGADTTTAALVGKAHDGAGKAIPIIQSLPENIADALTAITRAQSALLGQPDPQAETAAAGPVKPAFDVLRVEPDGSTVIAGSAEPGAKLEIVDGDKVVTTTQAGPSGDFAAVLDNPLPAGDHELVLRSTGKDGKPVTSEEIATVSVPKDDSTELLAMVSKPGKASRIITAPTAKQARISTSDQPQASTASASASQSNAAVASAAPASNPATPPSPASSAQPDVMVNAVEIENDKIFVAGTTRPNAKVRAYADDKLIGEIAAGPDGHFVVDGVMPLSVGDHKIRVDVVDAAGKVLVRVSVNFNRPEGNQVTVAAQPPGTVPGNAGASMVPLDEGELGKMRMDAGKAFGLLKGLFADGKTPGPEELAAARSATEIALKSLAEFRPGIDATAIFKQAAATASDSAAKALAFLQGLPKDAKSIGAALGDLDRMIASITKPLANAPAQTTVEAASGEAASGGAAGPKTIEQAPLTTNANAVIIRRGDTLWQISRRTYGLGVRYTTIYLANEDKINNPDRILPGQIFGLPKDALPNSEELHRKRMSEKRL